MATVTTTTDPKPGIKSTEFWAAIGIGGLPLLEGTGWFKNWPITEGGEIAMWCVAGAVMCSYIWSRAWVKIQGRGDENAKTSVDRVTNAIRTGK